MISLTRIFEETSSLLPNIVIYGKDHPSLISLEFLESGQHDFADNVLYIGYASKVENISNYIKNCILLTVRDCNLSTTVLPPGI